MSELQVSTYVAEADAGNTEVGQPATITFPALNETAAGTVTSIDLVSTVNNNVVEYGVTVTLDDPFVRPAAGADRLGQHHGREQGRRPQRPVVGDHQGRQLEHRRRPQG